MESQFSYIHKLIEELQPNQSLKNLHEEICQISRNSIEKALLLDSGVSQLAQMIDKHRDSSELLASLKIEETAALALESISGLNISDTAESAFESIAGLNILDTAELNLDSIAGMNITDAALFSNLLAENAGEMLDYQRKLAEGYFSTSELAKETIRATEILANYTPDVTLSSLMSEAESIASFSKHTDNLFQSSIEAIDAIRGNSSIYDLLSSNIRSFNNIVKNNDEFSDLKSSILKKEKYNQTNTSKKEKKLKQTINFYAQFLEVLKLVKIKTKSINLSTSDYIALASLVFTLIFSQNSSQNNNVTTTNITNNITNHYGNSPKSLTIKKPKSDIGTKITQMRQVSGSNVILRYQPNRQSDFIEYLQNGETLQIIDNTNRKWLQVKVKINNEYLEGWVFRRYTKRIKK